MTEFWRRWHISLGTWFRDYVYIPLGGNRCGLGRQFLNIFIVWALTGFWHGANWTFLCWGVYYAFFLMLEKAFLLKGLNRAPATVGHVYALLVAVCGWVMFDLDSIVHAAGYYKAMFGLAGAGTVSPSDIFYLRNYMLLLIVSVVACTPLGKKLYVRLPDKLCGAVGPVLTLAVLVLSTAYLVDATYNPFLYFRF